MSSGPDLNRLLRQFATTMARSFDVSDVLYELCDRAVEVLGATGAGVSVVTEEGRLEFVTATSESVVEVEQSQQRQQEGPCVEAFRTGEVIAVSDIATLDSWPDYQRSAARAGFASVVGLPMSIDSHRVGSVNVYDREVREWSPADLEAASVLADVATAYVVRAGELAEARQLSDQLQRALDSRVVIEQAKGMLARDHAVTVDAAFDLLRRHARENNAPLRDVAHAVVHGGTTVPRGGDAA